MPRWRLESLTKSQIHLEAEWGQEKPGESNPTVRREETAGDVDFSH